jgi:hypothetical protein
VPELAHANRTPLNLNLGKPGKKYLDLTKYSEKQNANHLKPEQTHSRFAKDVQIAAHTAPIE